VAVIMWPPGPRCCTTACTAALMNLPSCSPLFPGNVPHQTHAHNHTPACKQTAKPCYTCHNVLYTLNLPQLTQLLASPDHTPHRPTTSQGRCPTLTLQHTAHAHSPYDHTATEPGKTRAVPPAAPQHNNKLHTQHPGHLAQLQQPRGCAASATKHQQQQLLQPATQAHPQHAACERERHTTAAAAVA